MKLNFPYYLDQERIKGLFCQHEEAFAAFSSIFRDVIDRHEPFKQNTEIMFLLWVNNYTKQLWIDQEWKIRIQNGLLKKPF